LGAPSDGDDLFRLKTLLLYIEEIRGNKTPEALIQLQYFESLTVIDDDFLKSGSSLRD
jgi:hypothetical protein